MLSPAAKNLKLIRVRLFLTQEAFGNYFKLTRHQVNSYEIGRAKVPASLINQLCNNFGLSARLFVEEDIENENQDLVNVTQQVLERQNEVPIESPINEWREKYYSVLEKYNEALEELRRYKSNG